jgi:hypothetical protein
MKRIGLVLMVSVLAVATASAENEEPGYVMHYYLTKLDSVFSASYIFNTGIPFSFHIRSIMELTNHRGELQGVDTADCEIFFGVNGKDSVLIIDSARMEENKLPDSFQFLQPWRENNSFYFYPNDTGSGRMAIGFEPRPHKDECLPTGFFNMERDGFNVLSLFLYYPEPEDFERLSATFTYDRPGQFLFLRRIVIQGIKAALLGRRYSRQSLEFYNYQLR